MSKTNKQKPIEEFEREELIRLIKEISILKYKYYSKKAPSLATRRSRIKKKQK